MKRIFGCMPSSEIEITKYFRDDRGNRIKIDAGKHGWTIILFPDNSSMYEDVEGTAEENFDRAYKVALSRYDNITEIQEG